MTQPSTPGPHKRRATPGPAHLPSGLADPEHVIEAGEAARRDHRAVRQSAAELKEHPTLEGLIEKLQIGRWDFIIVGDGSATQWKYPGGWASVLIMRTGQRKAFYGGVSCLTNIVAELMAYVHPLMFLSAHLPQGLIRHVHIVTDCEHLPQSAENPAGRRKNVELWAMVDAFKYRGFAIKWHWIPRDTIDLNQFCHNMANQSRKVIKEQQTATSLSPLNVRSVYQLSPAKKEAPSAK